MVPVLAAGLRARRRATALGDSSSQTPVRDDRDCIDRLNGNIDFINTADSTLQGGGPPLNGPDTGCHAIAEADGTVYVVAGRDNIPFQIPRTLFSLDVTTGEVTAVGALTFEPRAIASTPPNF